MRVLYLCGLGCQAINNAMDNIDPKTTGIEHMPTTVKTTPFVNGLPCVVVEAISILPNVTKKNTASNKDTAIMSDVIMFYTPITLVIIVFTAIRLVIQ